MHGTSNAPEVSSSSATFVHIHLTAMHAAAPFRIASTLLLMTALGGALSVRAQVFSNKEMGWKNAALADSLKNSEYPYILPIWGAKACAILVGFLVNFSLSHFIVFRQRQRR